MNRRTQRGLLGILKYLAVLTLIVLTLAPVAWLVISSLSSNDDLTRVPLEWLPKSVDWSRYAELLGSTETARTFLLALRNSLFVALSATLISLALSIPAAYSFSRFADRRSGLLYAVLATYMIPPVALVLPLYALLARVGLLNQAAGLTLVYCTILTPFTTWLLKTNFDSVPLKIEEAALLDGLNRWGVLWRMTVPLSLPGVSTAAVWAVLIAWDEFFYALLFTSSEASKTLPVTIADFAAGRAVDYSLICAAGVLAALPPILIGFMACCLASPPVASKAEPPL